MQYLTFLGKELASVSENSKTKQWCPEFQERRVKVRIFFLSWNVSQSHLFGSGQLLLLQQSLAEAGIYFGYSQVCLCPRGP